MVLWSCVEGCDRCIVTARAVPRTAAPLDLNELWTGQRTTDDQYRLLGAGRGCWNLRDCIFHTPNTCVNIETRTAHLPSFAAGALSTLNTLAAEHSAVAIIHSGDFGFYEPSSLSTISDRTLKHLVQYSSLISPAFRSQLLSPNMTPPQMRELLAHPPKSANPSSDSAADSSFVLSEFPKLLSGELKLNVPVYTVWGACEDVAVLEKIRLAPPSALSVPSDPSKIPPVPPTTASRPSAIATSPPNYSIPNLTVLDEATTRVLLIGGVRLRLFGLGGAVVPHKLFDNGAGTATIAGGQGTMWTTMLQIGEIVDTAQKVRRRISVSPVLSSALNRPREQVYDATETRLLVSHASPGREGLLAQLALVLKADLTVSAGLHFRYGVSYNEFSVQHDPGAFKGKLEAAKKSFNDVWDAVKAQVEGVVECVADPRSRCGLALCVPRVETDGLFGSYDHSDNQKALLSNALAVANRVPATAPVQGGPAAEETAWKNCWNW
ncbi:SPOSA6832_04901, partial [Sporobolomyces salmonicolor]